MDHVDFVSHLYKYDYTKKKNMDWCVGRVEALCILSQIGLQIMRVDHFSSMERNHDDLYNELLALI